MVNKKKFFDIIPLTMQNNGRYPVVLERFISWHHTSW